MDSGLSIHGERESGADVRAANVTAVMALSNILRTSLGPQGLDKMLVDDIGDVTITNDGATILQQLEVEHPAAKVLVELANLQDTEVGDGTTSVVIIAAELLKRANELVKNNIHPTTIISGYRMAMKESLKYIQNKLTLKVDSLGEDTLLQIASTTLSSKFVGSEMKTFAKLVVDAVKAVKVIGADGKAKYPVSQVNVLKSHGQSSSESMLVPNGYALRLMRASQEMPTLVKNAKIALLDFDLKKFKMGASVNILIDNPEELEKIRQREMDITKEKITKILEAGTNVVFTTKGIDDMAMKYLVEGGVLGVRRVDKKDMKRIAKITGGTILLTMSTMDDAEESFDPSCFGEAEEVCDERVGDNDFIFIRNAKGAKAATVLLRGANEFMLEEADRSVHDALCAVSRTLECNSIVAGGGAVEAAVSAHLEDFARSIETYEQWAIAEFSEALLTIPKILAINAAKDSIDLLANLRSKHYAYAKECDEKAELRFSGLDLINGSVQNSIERGVLEPAVSKLKSLKFATEAAITILRIDDLVRVAPEPEDGRS